MQTMTQTTIQAAEATIHAPIAGYRTRNCGSTLREAIAFAERHAHSCVAVTAEGNGAGVRSGRGNGHTPDSADANVSSWPTANPSKKLFGELRGGKWSWRVVTYEGPEGREKLLSEEPIAVKDIAGI